jgi:hypothetical protein
MLNNIPEVNVDGTTWKQSLDRVDGSNNKLKFTQTEINSDGGEENLYEFNLSDINSRGLGYKVKGKELSIQLVTNYEADIIKHYKDGEIQDYANEMKIYFSDVELARSFIGALESIIVELKGE